MKRTLTLVLMLAFGGCSLLDSEDGQVTVRTDQSIYSPEAPVTISIVNNMGSSVFWLRHCDLSGQTGTAVETMRQGAWQLHDPPVGCTLGNVPTVEIQSGDTHKFTVRFSEKGHYRYRLPLSKSTAIKHLLPVEERVSNPFFIEEDEARYNNTL